MQALPASDDTAHAAGVVEWLVESGLGGCEVPHIVAGLGRRLNAADIAVDRVGCAIAPAVRLARGHLHADERTLLWKFLSRVTVSAAPIKASGW
jgi:hypothetical protein